LRLFKARKTFCPNAKLWLFNHTMGSKLATGGKAVGGWQLAVGGRQQAGRKPDLREIAQPTSPVSVLVSFARNGRCQVRSFPRRRESTPQAIGNELVAALSAFLTAGSSLQKRELPARFTRFEWGMHG
jgi:hypothetical protein